MSFFVGLVVGTKVIEDAKCLTSRIDEVENAKGLTFWLKALPLQIFLYFSEVTAKDHDEALFDDLVVNIEFMVG